MIMRRFCSIILALVIACTPTGAQVVQLADCPLQCDVDHSNVCIEGNADYSGHIKKSNGQPLDFHDQSNLFGFHCNCTEGRTGLECKREYKTCDNSGGHKCYNGGTCVEGETDGFGNVKSYCNCHTAKDPQGNLFWGEFCEKEVLEVCDGKKDEFCVNGGTCNANADRLCNCNDELFDGPHCEFIKNEFPPCDLHCVNDGNCQLGIKSYNQAAIGYNTFWENTNNFMYCSCMPGFYGLNCEIKSTLCGDHHCFNGGTCRNKLTSDGTSYKQHCDCTTAATRDKSYSGEYCEYESTSFCSKNAYCVNGGTCKSNEDAHLGCDCPDGFAGPICEFSESSPNIDENLTCRANCLNGGRCRKGSKDLGYLKKLGIVASHLTIEHTIGETNEHCACPFGFTGLRCDTNVQECSGEHLCLHGSQCIATGDGHDCDCDIANGIVAGKFCEHKHTIICTSDPGSAKLSGAFCVNEGECIEVIGPNESHQGCKCSDEFYGEHCEFSRTNADIAAEDTLDSKLDIDLSPAFIALFAVAAVTVVMATLAIIARVRKDRNSRMDSKMEPPSLPFRSTRKRGSNLAHLESASLSHLENLDLRDENRYNRNELYDVEIS